MLSNIIISDETNSDYTSKLKLLLNEIQSKKTFSLKNDIKLNIIIPNEYNQSVYDYSPEYQKKHFRIYGIPEGNGHYFPPFDSEDKIHTIILNKSVFSDLLYIGTFFHEFTHVIDFINYIGFYGNPNFMDEKNKSQNYYYEFYLWTEFNAKKIGQKRFIEELKKYDKSIALKETAEYFMSDITKESSEIRKLYLLMYFYARISAEENDLIKLNSNFYPKYFIEKYLSKELLELHSVMENIHNFSSFQNEKKLIKYLCKW